MIWRLLARALGKKQTFRAVLNMLLEAALTEENNAIVVGMFVYDKYASTMQVVEKQRGVYYVTLGEEKE